MMFKDFPGNIFKSSNLFLIEVTLMYDKAIFLGQNALRLYKPSNDGTSLLGEACKIFQIKMSAKNLKNY